MNRSRSEALLVGDEGAQMQAFLDDNREQIATCLHGLTDEQARMRLVPSVTTPASILKHCIYVERAWFQITVEGRTSDELGIAVNAGASWALADDDTNASLEAAYRSAWADSDRVAAGLAMDDLAPHNRRGPITLRWIYAHMIEELARHAGHADILREQLLAMSRRP